MHCSFNGDLFLLYALQSNIGFAGLFEYPEIRVVEGFGVRKKIQTKLPILPLLYFCTLNPTLLFSKERKIL